MDLAQASSETCDPDTLHTCLQILGDESSKGEQRVAIETLLKLCRNIQSHPGEEKYLKIRRENKAIHDKLLKFDGVREFLLAMGWSDVDGFFLYLGVQDLSAPITILEEQLNTLPPATSTASSSSVASPVQSHVSDTIESSVWTKEELEKRERRLEDDKKKRMEAHKRTMKEKEAIKKQIKDDRKDTSTRESKPSHARHMGYGANFKKFENTGGGG